jgi:hypothetical protein
MVQGENKSMEDYEEIFQLSYNRVDSCTLDDNYLKFVFLRGLREKLVETMNLLSNGYIF